MARLPYASVAAEGYRHFLALHQYLARTGLGAPLLNLIYLRVSQINGCPYCVDMHWRDARKAGESDERLNALVVWRNTPFFSGRERAALGWAEAVTRLRDQHVSDEEFEQVKQHFTERDLADLTFAVANINALNRIAIAYHVSALGPKAADYANVP